MRLYDRLFTVPEPDAEENFREHLNPDSLEVLADSRIEASIAASPPAGAVQFERQGYFCVDGVDTTAEVLVFNRIVTLRDSWAKVAARD